MKTVGAKLLLSTMLSLPGVLACGPQQALRIERLPDNPIIRPAMLPKGDGENINGPSMIRVPDWVQGRLGQYYLYFAHHQGHYIRLAYADSIAGPWTVYEPGTLRMEDTVCDSIPRPDLVAYKHVASPDVQVDEAAREIRMYFHCPAFVGGNPEEPSSYRQVTLVARSQDGVHFVANSQPLGNSYFRVFSWDGMYYALAMPGVFYRSRDGISEFEQGPTLFSDDMRHSAVKVDGNILLVFYTVVGENPERILLSRIDLAPDWMEWQESDPVVVLEPAAEWEGSALPHDPSVRGAALEPVRQLRDPALFEQDGRSYLLYSVAGEQGIAIARIHWR